jgi:adenylosuccinate synthase
LANTVVVVGTQWGDEGKGKITDYLASKADVVVRSQGGNNAGHTIFFGQRRFALHLIPSGIFNPKCLNVMAGGMVVNPKAMLEELAGLHQAGIQDYHLYLSDRAHVVMPYHLAMDELYEKIRLADPVGTTKKGIGPAYADKATRLGIRIGDLLDHSTLEKAIHMALTYYNPVLKAFEIAPFSETDMIERYYQYGQALKPFVTDTSILINQAIDSGKKILFEGAQGSMLCIEHGTYPYVTSSSPTAASVPLNVGIAPRHIQEVCGIAKAYSTRVGAGVFPTEFEDEIAKQIRERGHEYGTTTGRPRRIGWLDTVVLRHAIRINGVTGLSIMLLDVLSGLDEIKICTGYRLNGQLIDSIPGQVAEYAQVQPEYLMLPGWKEDITQVKTLADFPDNCKRYLDMIEELTKTKITIVSVGPDRNQTVILQQYFK